MSYLGEPKSKTMDQLTRDTRALVDKGKPQNWLERPFWQHLEELLTRLEQEEGE